MIIDLWSFEKLDIDLRVNFELIAYPNSEYHAYFEKQLRDLSVFRFTCSDVEVCPNEILISRENPEDLNFPFPCYFNSCAIDDETLKIIDWPMDNPAGEPLHKQLMAHPVTKDNKAWFSWNVKYDVLRLRKGCIQTKIVEGAYTSLVANETVERL